jgi:hypothetical protein
MRIVFEFEMHYKETLIPIFRKYDMFGKQNSWKNKGVYPSDIACRKHNFSMQALSQENSQRHPRQVKNIFQIKIDVISALICSEDTGQTDHVSHPQKQFRFLVSIHWCFDCKTEKYNLIFLEYTSFFSRSITRLSHPPGVSFGYWHSWMELHSECSNLLLFLFHSYHNARRLSKGCLRSLFHSQGSFSTKNDRNCAKLSQIAL